MIRIFIVTAFFAGVLSSNAQLINRDSTAHDHEHKLAVDSLRINTVDPNQLGAPLEFNTILDQSLNGYHRYQSYEQQYLGNYGQVAVPLVWKPDSTLGFDFGWLPHWREMPNSFTYYDVNIPYTVGKAIIGAQQEQHLLVTHAQNVNPVWNVGFDFRRWDSDGFYANNTSVFNQLNIHTNYRSISRRYEVFANFLLGTYQNLENGGLSDTDLFEAGTVVNTQILPVNYDDVLSARKSNGLVLRQHLYLGPKLPVQDSTSPELIEQKFRLVWQARMDNRRYRYRDNFPYLSGYDTTYFDSTITNEVAQVYGWRNDLWMENVVHRDSTNAPLRWRVGAWHEGRDVWIENDTSFEASNLAVSGAVEWSRKAMRLNSKLDYVLSGFNGGDYHGNAGVEWTSTSVLSNASAGIEFSNQRPSFQESYYNGNHFRWSNDFGNVSRITGSIRLRSDQVKAVAEVKYSQVDGFIYFDSVALPQQSTSAVQLLQLKGVKNFQFGKWHWDNTLHYQVITGDDYAIRVPDLVAQSAFYFASDSVFKGALQLQIGVQALYYSDYLGYDFSAPTGRLFVQDNESFGNYPFVDFFLNARIKQVRLFVQATHLNAGLMGNNYYVAPLYPLPGRAFKLGLEWRFFN